MYFVLVGVLCLSFLVALVVVRRREQLELYSPSRPDSPFGSVAEILASGRQSLAFIELVTSYGMVAPNGDPLLVFTLHVMPEDESPFEAMISQRVPVEKLGLHIPGQQLIVSYDPNNRTRRCAIDWEATVRLHSPEPRPQARPLPESPQPTDTPVN